MNYRDALGRLFALRRFGVRPGLQGVRRALQALGNPHQELRVIHIAGTNGKGSTAAFCEAVLRAAGFKTGLYTSPHLHRLTERIRVGGCEVEPAEIAALTARILAVEEVTFFEALTAMAFCLFVQKGVEVAVIEAGLGGRLDATNVIPRPLVTVVTGVALDHMEVLGPTLGDIAREKAGIWRPEVPAVIACDDAPARQLLLDEATRRGAPAYLRDRDFYGRLTELHFSYAGPGGPLDVEALGLEGPHQASNAAVALAALGLLPAPFWGRAVAARAAGLTDVRWPGRLEWLTPSLLIDAAHNPDGAQALANALAQLRARRRPIRLLFGVVSDKDAAAMLASLAPQVDEIVLTRPRTPRARDPESLRSLVAAAARCVPSLAEALALPGDVAMLTVVAGSIFLIAEARELVLGEPADPLWVQDPPAARAGLPSDEVIDK